MCVGGIEVNCIQAEILQGRILEHARMKSHIYKKSEKKQFRKKGGTYHRYGDRQIHHDVGTTIERIPGSDWHPKELSSRHQPLLL